MVVAGSNICALDRRIRYLLKTWVMGFEPPQWVWDQLEVYLMGKGKLISNSKESAVVEESN
jgi:hypothetical protein